MLTVSNLSLQFGGSTLFKNVDLMFGAGNCYGIIGANGAGKSTFLKVLSGEIEPNKGEVIITEKERLSVLKQDHFAYDDKKVLETVMMGNSRLFEIMQRKEELYSKPDFNDEDGIKLAELEGEFAEMDGWNAEVDAEIMLNGLGIGEELHNLKMKELDGNQKVKVLLAQALFGNPDVLLLDEPMNGLDNQGVEDMRKLFQKLKEEGRLILLASHSSEDIEVLCDQVFEMDAGILGERV